MPDRMEMLREASERAAAFRNSDLMTYEHGGGRLAILRDGERTLVADFYGDGGNRDFFMLAAGLARDLLSGTWPDQEAVERAARAICSVHGRDPDEDAPLSAICGPNYEVLPWWTFYEEEARAALTAALGLTQDGAREEGR